MAGDWIKFETNTPDKPEVHRMARELGLDPDAVVGKLARIWCWVDQQALRAGEVQGALAQQLDRIAHCEGFAAAMYRVGWLEGREDALVLPNFDRHNGVTAKSRALGRNRVEKHRNGGPPQSPQQRAATGRMVDREPLREMAYFAEEPQSQQAEPWLREEAALPEEMSKEMAEPRPVREEMVAGAARPGPVERSAVRPAVSVKERALVTAAVAQAMAGDFSLPEWLAGGDAAAVVAERNGPPRGSSGRAATGYAGVRRGERPLLPGRSHVPVVPDFSGVTACNAVSVTSALPEKEKSKNEPSEQAGGASPGVDEEVFVRYSIPTLEKVLAYARIAPVEIGEACARGFFDQMEGGDWLLNNGRKIADWRAILRRYASRWLENEAGKEAKYGAKRSEAVGKAAAVKPVHSNSYEECIPLRRLN